MPHDGTYPTPDDASQNGRPVDELERGLHRAHATLARISEELFDGRYDTAAELSVATEVDLDVMLWRVHGDALAERRRQAAIDDAAAAMQDVDIDGFVAAVSRMDPADRDVVLDWMRAQL